MALYFTANRYRTQNAKILLVTLRF